MTPRWIPVTLDSRAFRLLARIALMTPFWLQGARDATHWPQTVQLMRHFGLQPPELFGVATVMILIVGSVLVIVGGRWTWISAGAMALFTAATIPVAHPFWKLEGDAKLTEIAIVQEHISIIGGMMLAAILSHRRQWVESE